MQAIRCRAAGHLTRYHRQDAVTAAYAIADAHLPDHIGLGRETDQPAGWFDDDRNSGLGTLALLDDLPEAQWLLGDRGYDADWFRVALQAKGIEPCIPGRKSRLEPIRYDNRRYRRPSRVEIMFGRLKDWRRVATRYDRCPTVFFSAVALAATVIFQL